jgi:hypothetical protein
VWQPKLRGFGFGKAAPGSSEPALYLVGVANGQRGILRSDDWARTWVHINDDQHQFGSIGQITGDPKLYGRVYVGAFGRGILYGDPVRKKSEPAPAGSHGTGRGPPNLIAHQLDLPRTPRKV